MLIFDSEEHAYYLDGERLPSVTEILKMGPWAKANETATGFEIPEDVMEFSRERGIAIHKAIELLLEGTLDRDDLDEEIAPYVEAFEAWSNEVAYTHQHSELRLCHETDRFAGTVDLVGYVGDRLAVIDIKTGSAGLKPWHKYQLAAYSEMFNDKYEDPPELRVMLHLKNTGKAKAHYFPKKDQDWHYEVFQACYTLWTAQKLEGK